MFEGVDERQDSSFYASRDPAGHRVAGGRRAAGLLGWGAGHQTLLIPKLKERKSGEGRRGKRSVNSRGLQERSVSVWRCLSWRESLLDRSRLLHMINSND